MAYLLILLAALVGIWAVAEAHWVLRVVHHQIGSRGVRILFVSDLHCSRFHPPARIDRIIRRAEQLNPDLVLLGGDYVERGNRYVDRCISQLARLKAHAAVLGNHDIQTHRGENPRSAVVAALEERGIPLLNNTSMMITVKGIHIQIIGTADARRDIAYAGHLTRDDRADMLILLSHSPDFLPSGAGHLDLDLALCGHTHGGQITLFGRPITTHSRYGRILGRGLCTYRSTPVVISNGVGTTILPLRFWAPCAVDVIDL